MLRDSNEELPTLLCDIEGVCAKAVDEYNCVSSSMLSEYDNQSTVLKLYVVNCDATHIVTHSQIAKQLEDAEDRGLHRVSQSI